MISMDGGETTEPRPLDLLIRDSFLARPADKLPSALSKVKIGDSTFPIQHLNWRKSTRNAIHDLPPILKLSFDAALARTAIDRR